ncbi:adenylyl-sulfate kinase [Nocardiopsis sediminis]|uniref:Adenylyl-sulfate kinase n=1 Tax=Nocardiopsis sediminis TaxID=1778267 RepID=A0ABV8FFF8_9ACTN
MSVGESGHGGGPAAPVFAPDPVGLAHLEAILSGAYPLAGFMTAAEAASVAGHGRLPDGTPWPVPVTLAVPAGLADAARLVLTDPEGAPLAELTVSERWWSGPGGPGTEGSSGEESAGPGTPDPHGALDRRGPADGHGGPGHRLAGEVRFIRPSMYGSLRHLRRVPADVRARREAGGAPDRPLLAVVTGRPLHHRALHQIRAAADRIGGGRRAEVLVIIDAPFDGEGMAPAILAAEPLLPARTRFAVATLPPADPALPEDRADLLAAHVARSYGATHVLIDRDPDARSAPAPAGPPIPVLHPGDWRYDTGEELWLPAERVDPAHARTEPGDAEVEESLALGRELPAWFTPARVAAELARLRPARTRRGLTVFFTGLSGSGKSTVARGVSEAVRRSGRTVTLLDGDVVRRMLSSGLTFSRADRDLNIRRIGFVAAEITRHGGVAICAPIAPYAVTRAEVRAMVEDAGDFFLVHVATPLEVCEARDRKGLYAKARAGEIPEFTGVSDPYEEPTDADLVLHTEGRSVAESVAEAVAALRTGGWLPTDRP